MKLSNQDWMTILEQICLKQFSGPKQFKAYPLRIVFLVPYSFLFISSISLVAPIEKVYLSLSFFSDAASFGPNFFSFVGFVT